MRTMGLIAGNLSSPVELETNLGIQFGYHIRLPSTTSPVLLFGTPDNYQGERGSLYLAIALASDCSAFLDVGAHHGYFIFFLIGSVGNAFPIYFFEPNERLFREISRNVDSNALKSVRGFQMAMGATCGATKFHLNLSNDCSSSLKTYFQSTNRTKEVEVAITTFSEFVCRHQLNNVLIKVDIEGAEKEFLRGVASDSNRIRYLIIEILGPAVQSGFILAAMRKLDMEAYYINDFSLEHSIDGSFTYVPPQYNWLFCHLTPEELSKRLEGTRFKVLESSRYQSSPKWTPKAA